MSGAAKATETTPALTLAELMQSVCPLHGKHCGRIPDQSRVYINGRPGGHIEVLCAYRLNAAFKITP